MINETYTLENGVTIPKLALGTWQIDNQTVTDVVRDAIDAGYRHIDTAVQYENEEGIGKGILASGVDRKELFVTTKIPGDIKTYEGTKQTIEESLKRLGTNYIDLLLIHAPKPWPELFAHSEKTYFKENLEVWKAMEEAYQEGRVRAIGVSNFEISDIQNLLDHAKIKPMVNQIRVHIGHTPDDVIRFCQKNRILVEAFSPNATGKLMSNPDIIKMAEKYHVSVPQLSIRYDLQLGLLPLPKSTHKDHMIQNAEVDFTISTEDMDLLHKVPEIESLSDEDKQKSNEA